MKMLLAGLILLVTFPPLVGSAAATIATAPHLTPAVRLFPWVPAGGYPDRFPYGWCTWWAAYNRHVTWNGNAADWLDNAAAQGFQTTASPTVGAIAVYRPGSGYSALGHVAIVIAVSGHAYTISEMYFVGFGEVNTRSIWWPDPHIAGFIPLSQEDRR